MNTIDFGGRLAIHPGEALYLVGYSRTLQGAKKTARNEEIESLRAIAILLTLFQHLPILLPSPSPPDWMTFIYDHAAFWGGVDLFFVISGFVVTTSLLNDAHGKAGEGSGIAWADAKRFWVRRLFRLLPLAWVWVGVVLLATAASCSTPGSSTGT